MAGSLSRATLAALQSFVEIARTGTLAEAGRELNVTPSALSHQLARLEEEIGVRLFERTGRGLALTPQGQRLYADALSIFAQLKTAVSKVKETSAREVLRVSSFHTFATRWLMRRLASFQKEMPDVEVKIATSTSDVFAPDKVDCAILFGSGNWRASCVELLYRESLIVVCSRDFDPERQIAFPADLGEQQLLVAKLSHRDWTQWMRAAGVAGYDAARYLTLENRNLVIEAAIRGLGVAIADRLIVKEELSSGLLRQVFPTVAEGSGAYYLVYGDGRTPVAKKVMRFRDWILREMREIEQSPI